MLFTSYGFIAFVAAVILLYYVVPKKTQWMLLLAASYFFYAFSGLWNFVFIFSVTVSCYVIARIIARMKEQEDIAVEQNRDIWSKDERKQYRAKKKKRRLLVLILGITLNIGVLAVIKYTAFALTNVNSVLALFDAPQIGIPSLILPMGISFFVFQSVAYLIDVYRGKTFAEKNIARFALFVSFFPQLVQGPISRHSDLAAQLYEPHKIDGIKLKFGLQRILWGFFKKLVIADRIMVAIKPLIGAEDAYNGAYVFVLIIFYSIQIYADFTGGIDITIGIAEALGMRLAENFNRPFSSRTTKEYWNRWHITMGSWFNDYIFLPLSVTK
ncbi:MAG: MBOAT family protein, partial [Ruminococcaceae bacterium]|nr:MBOAT family protein [Oscillospiraceae bacterium]